MIRSQVRSTSAIRWEDKRNADAEFAVRLAHKVKHLLPTCRVETRGRFVEKNYRRVVHQRLGKLHPLFHAGRITAHRPVSLFKQAGVPQRIGGPRPGVRGREPANLRHMSKKLGGRHIARQAIVLGHVTEPRPDHDILGSVLPQDQRRARRRLQQTEKYLDRGAFASAVLAQDPGDTVRNVEAHIVKRHHILVVLRKVLRAE